MKNDGFWFYHLEKSTVEAAIAPLLEKCLTRGWRAMVRGALAERLDALDQFLWTYRDESFLPHGLAGRCDPSRQPILLTTDPAPVNGAPLLFLIDGAPLGDVSAFSRVSVLFDGRDEDALACARAQWSEAKATGLPVSYWRETATGWAKQG